jgi:glycine/serine hydroxymethyltransferase
MLRISKENTETQAQLAKGCYSYEALRKLLKDHRTRLIILGYARLRKQIDWHPMKHRACWQ